MRLRNTDNEGVEKWWNKWWNKGFEGRMGGGVNRNVYWGFFFSGW